MNDAAPLYALRGHLNSAALRSLLEDKNPPARFDCGQLLFCDSDGLAALLKLLHHLDKQKQRGQFYRVPARLLQLLCFAGFDHIADFSLHPPPHSKVNAL